MAKQNKRRVIIIAVLALGALVLLAAGLSDMELLPGRSWSFWMQLLFGMPEEMPVAGVASAPVGDASKLARILSMLILAMLPIALIAFIFYPDARKQMLREFLRMLALWLLALLISRMGLLEPIAEMAEMFQPPFRDIEAVPGWSEDLVENMPEFAASSPPWLTWVSSLVLAVVLLVVILMVWRMVLLRLAPKPSPIQELVAEAEAAIAALQSGADFRDTIIRCYREMSEVLQAQQGIRRGHAMTPREFETRLVQQGLPREPVQQLTRLFELVRYGTLDAVLVDEQCAVTSLSAIVKACEPS